VRDERAGRTGWRTWGLALQPAAGRALPGLCVLALFALVLTGANPLGGLLRGLLLLGVASPLLLRLPWQSAAAMARGLHGGLLAVVLFAALVLRLQGGGFGLPYFEQPDEWNTADWAIRMVQTADYVPTTFTYPPLYTYMQAGVVAVHYLWGAGRGLYASVADLQSTLFYPWGRALTALIGAGTILLTYLLARRLYGREVALLAAAFLAFYPPHMRDSHYITTDIPLGFFATLALLCCAPLLEPAPSQARRLGQILLAGTIIGLAAATKYTVTALLAPLLVAAAYAAYHDGATPAARLRRGLGLATAGLGGVAAGFTLGNPFWLAVLPRMLDDIGRILINYKINEPAHRWAFFWGIARQDAWLLSWLGLAGAVLAAARRRPGDVLLLSFALPYFVQIANVPVVFFRNAQPIIPLLFIFAAVALVALLDLIERVAPPAPRRRALIGLALAALLLAAMLYPAQLTLTQSYAMAQPTTRLRADAWVAANAPAGARIWLEDQTLILPSERYRVGGGAPILNHPPEWYAERGFDLLVANVSRTPAAQRDELRALVEQAGVSFAASALSLGEEFAVIEVSRLVPPTAGPTPLEQPFGAPIMLEAYQHPAEVRAGAVLPLALFWRCLLPVGPDYIVYVHLLDAEGNRVAQRDMPPLEGTRRTPTWQVGERLRDDQDLPIPADTPPGTYRLEVGMYLPESFARLNPEPVYLGPVTIVP
jgi:4-amino-4-deoxy-L-arabinose transferase-like glycosyltransferase